MEQKLRMGSICEYRAETEDYQRHGATAGSWYPCLVIRTNGTTARLRVFFDTIDDTKVNVTQGEAMGQCRPRQEAFGGAL